jgi:hypothetical protein
MLFHYSNSDPNFSSPDFGENIFRSSICCEGIQKYIDRYTTARKNWAKAFRPMFEKSRNGIDTKDYLCANILMMKALSAKFVFEPTSEGGETYADAFFDDYLQIVELAANVLKQSADEDKTAPRKAVFNFDVNINASWRRCLLQYFAVEIARPDEKQLRCFGSAQGGRDSMIA